MEACHSRSNSASQSTTAAQTVALHSYAGKSIFITGVTGFVGKVVLEKLLRSVPKVERIYLLIRSNSRYPTAEERFQAEVATSTIFDVLKDEGEAEFAALCQRKLRFVSGELTAERFGLEESAFAELAAEASPLSKARCSAADSLKLFCAPPVTVISTSGFGSPQ